MFPGLLNQTCTISRMQPTPGDLNQNEELQQFYTGVMCHIEPLTTTAAPSVLLTELKFSIGQAYNCYFNAGQDVVQGDQLTINGNNYNVKLVQPYDAGPVSYISCMVELQET